MSLPKILYKMEEKPHKKIRETPSLKISRRDLHRKCRRFKTVDELNPIIDILISRGYLCKSKKSEFLINPCIQNNVTIVEECY